MKKGILRYKALFFEKKAWKKNLQICGIDEAGRGPLAGPVVISAAIIPINTKYHLLKDSKLLTHKELILAYNWINKNCIHSSVVCSWKTIDRINIYQATLESMKRAFLLLIENPRVQLNSIKYVLIDAMPLKLEDIFSHPGLEIHSFPYGESISSSIAAASIVAKVTRDKIMEQMNLLFPVFNLGQHKGYGTKEHWSLLGRYGETIIHRKSYLKNPIYVIEKGKQKNLFEDKNV